MENPFKKYPILLILLLAFFLRFWGIADYKYFSGDESMHIAALDNFFETGHFKPDVWTHPPLRYFLHAASIKAFGDNAYGWRMKNVLLGSLTVLALYLLGMELFGSAGIACLAALFLAVEPLHISFSKGTYSEVSVVFFFVWGAYFALRYMKGSIGTPIPAGVLMGLSLADKWFYPITLAALFFITLYVMAMDKRLDPLKALHVFSAYAVLPVGIYLLSFYPWFQRGGGLVDFLRMQVDAYREMQSMKIEMWPEPYSKLLPASAPWEWFVKPIISAFQISAKDGWGRYLAIMNNPPVWLFGFPAVFYTGYLAVRKAERNVIILFILFTATYVQFLLTTRPVFIPSALVILPFIYLMIANLLVSKTKDTKYGGFVYRSVTVFTVLFGLYIYPFVMMKEIPLLLYSPLLSLATITKMF